MFEECKIGKLQKPKHSGCKALKELVKQLNIPNLTQEDVKLKIKSIRSRYSSEQAKVLESEKSGAGRDDIYVRNYSGSNKLIYSCVLFVLQDSHH
jgi:hypothetical protein